MMFDFFITTARRFLFEFDCIIQDFIYLFVKFKEIREKSLNKDIDTVFICSLSFYYKNKWQVVSQSELWKTYSSKKNVIMCGSFISYYLFARNKKYVISLEAKYNAPTIRFSKKHKKSAMFVSDSHSKKWLNTAIVNNNITDILTPYRKTLISLGYANYLSESKIHSFPWCVSDRVLLNEKIVINDSEVMGFGKTGVSLGVYDQREWSINSSHILSFNYAGSGNQVFKGDDYYKWLRTFDACVVAMSTHDVFNYTVAKYFEVPSQGMLLIAFPSVDLEEFGFIDDENCIFVDRYNFEDKVKKYKVNPEKYISIRESGLDLIKKRHTVSRRIIDLNEIISS